MNRPLAFDLFCGLGGWTDGLLAAGWNVIGFDIERHDYGTGKYPGQLVLQDALTLHGSQFRHADLIVASPPCTEYSYMAMPWSRAKQIARALRGDGEFPEGYTGSRTIEQLNALFDACFRIQREASEGAGRHIPMIVENVRGAQPWVGRAPWNYGSYYLWGDVPGLMPIPGSVAKFNPDGTNHGTGSWFAAADSKERGARKVPGLDWSKHGQPGYADGPGRAFNTTAEQRLRDGQKVPGFNFHQYEQRGKGGSFQSAAVLQSASNDSRKGKGSWFGTYADMKAEGRGSMNRYTSSRSLARKAASAAIAKIPFHLARWIGEVFYPRDAVAGRESCSGAGTFRGGND